MFFFVIQAHFCDSNFLTSCCFKRLFLCVNISIMCSSVNVFIVTLE